MSEIIVSIIIPIYNVEKFLQETILSVLNQTLKEIEIILVNDGSSDNSLKICKEYAAKDKRIKLLNQENCGVSIARNNGLKIASGDYIFFMDSDDTIDKNFIESSYKIAMSNNFELVVLGDYFCNYHSNLMALPTCAMFINHNFLKVNSNIRFPENIQPAEDGVFSHMLLALTTNVGYNNNCIYYYRKHENQNHLTSNKNVDSVINQIQIYLKIIEDFYTVNSLYKKKALHLALFIEHEPFEFRYLSMPLNDIQKSRLKNIISEFYKNNIKHNLTESDKLKLSKPFLYFIKSNSIDEFDKFYTFYTFKTKVKLKLKKIFINIIPISKLRKKLRKKYLKK